MDYYSRQISELIEELSKLPGVGNAGSESDPHVSDEDPQKRHEFKAYPAGGVQPGGGGVY